MCLISGKVICPLIATKVLSEYLVDKQQKFYKLPIMNLGNKWIFILQNTMKEEINLLELALPILDFHSFHLSKISWNPQNDVIPMWFDNIFHILFIILQNTLKEEKNLLELALPMSEFVVEELEYSYESENVELYF